MFNCYGNLIVHGFLKVIRKSDKLGKPNKYVITSGFLDYFIPGFKESLSTI